MEAVITLQLLPAEDKKKPGTIAGSTGVNSYFGTYMSQGPGTIQFSQIGSTKRAGPPEAMQRETQFERDLQRICSYRLHGDMVSMADVAGQTLLVWRR